MGETDSSLGCDISTVLQRINEIANAMVGFQTEITSIKWDLVEVKVAKTTQPAQSNVWEVLHANNHDNRVPDLHETRPVNLVLAQQPQALTDHLHNNPSLQSLVDLRMLTQGESVSQDLISPGNKCNKQVKSGPDRIAGNDYNRRFISWPQEHVFVGMARQHVNFDDLTQTQFSAGMLSVIEKEQNIETKNAIISFVSQIQQDMIDFGYQTILGITSVNLTTLEEKKIEWTDSDDINAMQKQYILN